MAVCLGANDLGFAGLGVYRLARAKERTAKKKTAAGISKKRGSPCGELIRRLTSAFGLGAQRRNDVLMQWRAYILLAHRGWRQNSRDRYRPRIASRNTRA
jgi:hypothetical protein